MTGRQVLTENGVECNLKMDFKMAVKLFNKSQEVAYLTFDQVEVLIADNNLYASCESLAADLNAALATTVRSLLNHFDDGSSWDKDAWKTLKDYMYDETDGTRIIFFSPSPAVKTASQGRISFSSAWVQSKHLRGSDPTDRDERSDGMLLSMPSVSLLLKPGYESEIDNSVQIESRFCDILVQGMFFRDLLVRNIDIEVRDAWKLLEKLSSDPRTLTQTLASVDGEELEKLRSAIELVCNRELEKCDTTEASRPLSVQVSVGTVRILGRVSTSERAVWAAANAHSMASPVWVLFPSLCEIRRVIQTLSPFVLVALGDVNRSVAELGDFCNSRLLQLKERAIDYHRLDLQGAHIVVAVAFRGLYDLTYCIRDILKHKVKSYNPDHFAIKLVECRFDVSSLWPSLGIFNRTAATLIPPGIYCDACISYDWSWSQRRKRLFFVSMSFFALLTMDMLPGTAGWITYLWVQCSNIDRSLSYRIEAVIEIVDNSVIILMIPAVLQAVSSYWSRLYGFGAGFVAWMLTQAVYQDQRDATFTFLGMDMRIPFYDVENDEQRNSDIVFVTLMFCSLVSLASTTQFQNCDLLDEANSVPSHVGSSLWWRLNTLGLFAIITTVLSTIRLIGLYTWEEANNTGNDCSRGYLSAYLGVTLTGSLTMCAIWLYVWRVTSKLADATSTPNPANFEAVKAARAQASPVKLQRLTLEQTSVPEQRGDSDEELILRANLSIVEATIQLDPSEEYAELNKSTNPCPCQPLDGDVRRSNAFAAPLLLVKGVFIAVYLVRIILTMFIRLDYNGVSEQGKQTLMCKLTRHVADTSTASFVWLVVLLLILSLEQLRWCVGAKHGQELLDELYGDQTDQTKMNFRRSLGTASAKVLDIMPDEDAEDWEWELWLRQLVNNGSSKAKAQFLLSQLDSEEIVAAAKKFSSSIRGIRRVSTAAQLQPVPSNLHPDELLMSAQLMPDSMWNHDTAPVSDDQDTDTVLELFTPRELEYSDSTSSMSFAHQI